MLPYQTLIVLDRKAGSSLTWQITNAFIYLIKQGVLPPSARLPGTRTLAELLSVHRQTVVAAFEELALQGWIEQLPARGAFVSSRMPTVTPRPLGDRMIRKFAGATGFGFKPSLPVQEPLHLAVGRLGFNDGQPDVRLAPLDELSRNYRRVCQRPFQRNLLSYTDPNGCLFLRQHLADYLQNSRGIPAGAAQVFTTRGSIMAIYLLAQILLAPGDTVLVGQVGYQTGELIFRQRGARLERIAVDEQGVSVDEVEAVCRRQAVRLMYLTPHHHYPTTATLSADRRVRLLALAQRYGFIIMEDDYDYDFHYAGSPILPLASADEHGMVVYIGSLSKTIAPAFRVGYIVAPTNLIEELGRLRRIVDRQGDNLLEQAIGELFAEGIMQRHLKKAQRAYHQRRDHLCARLNERLKDFIQFTPPEGGMAVWARFDPSLDLPALVAYARASGLWLNEARSYPGNDGPVQGLRLGFAATTETEIDEGVRLLERIVSERLF